MFEVLRQEVIQPKKATAADRAISWMCDHWQKTKPDHFADRPNQVIEDSHDQAVEKTVAERDLEVVNEVLALYETAKENGDLVAKEKNPLGEAVRELTMLFLSDTHLPGGNLEEEVYEKNQPYVFLKKARALFLGILGKSLTDKFRLRSMDELRADVREQTGIDSFNAFLALKNAFMRSVIRDRESGEAAQILLAHVGDNISNEQKMGDVAYSAAQLEEMRQELADFTHQKTTLTKAQGNHDTDLINYGLEHDAFDRELFGSQVFLQEIGDDLLVLSLNTNLYSTFWHEHLERRKTALNQRLEQVKTMIGASEEKAHLEQMNDRELAALAMIRAEMQKQQQLVEEATSSGKRLILIGHERGYLEQALGDNLAQTNVVAIVSGHTHRHSSETQVNSHGETVHYLNTGANQKVKTASGEKGVLSGFSLKVRDTAEKGLEISVEEVIPTAADYDQGVFSMT